MAASCGADTNDKIHCWLDADDAVSYRGRLPMKHLGMLLMLASLAPACAAQITAGELKDTCSSAQSAVRNKAVQGKPEQWKWEKDKPNAIYSAGWCSGYVRGALQGLNGMVLPLEKPVVLRVKSEEIKSEWDVVAAFLQYMNANPLANGKPADVVLLTALVDHDMIESTPFVAGSALKTASQ